MQKSLLCALTAVTLSAGALTAQQAVRDLPMLVDAEWLAENLDAPELVVINVDQQRTSYDEGHIPGAFHLPYNRIAIEKDGLPSELPAPEALFMALRDVGVRDDTYIVLYGSPLPAARAWMTLDYLGLSNVAAILDGGINAWKAANQPLSTAAPAPRTGQFSMVTAPEKIVDAAWMQARIGDPNVVMIDARPPNEYTGADGGRNGQYLAGHIPGARNLYHEDLMAEDGKLLPLEELRARFEAVGASEDKTIAVYCFIGMRASTLYFVSKMLGYETVLYDGSWTDWSARKLPFEAGPDPLASGR